MTTLKKNQSVKNDPSNNPKLIKKVWDKEVLDAIKNGKGYKTAKDLFKDIEK
jgi:hypothetical protein